MTNAKATEDFSQSALIASRAQAIQQNYFCDFSVDQCEHELQLHQFTQALKNHYQTSAFRLMQLSL